jgi:UDP-N-acetylglucosamine 2-epimerase (non-hydrolysing)
MKKILFVFGTRPEAIKMAPLIIEMAKLKNSFDVKVCVTAQHRSMLDQVLSFFNIKPDYDLDLMRPNQTLADVTSASLKGISSVIIRDFDPEYIIVQGDTTSALAGALCGFYSKKKVIHIEAGLRSFDKFSPFPEEMNRVLISRLTDLHFAPTGQARKNLLNEGIPDNKIWNVGNTVIDALFLGLNNIRARTGNALDKQFPFLRADARIILVTGHRRENFGEPFENICLALKTIAERNKDVQIIYPVHLNPNVQEPVKRILGDSDRIHLIEPLDYPALVWLLNKSCLVITDSGGIQEEGPALGKPVLVMREVTERMEGVDAGTAVLVGTDRNKITQKCQALLDDPLEYNRMAKAVNPYGDGTSCQQIISVLLSRTY